MLTQKQRPALRTNLKTFQRRPSSVFLDAFSSREEAERLKRDVEASDIFAELLRKGIIRKVFLKGLIPLDKYLSYRLKEAIAFINRYDLESHPEWAQVFRSQQTEEYVTQLAERWRVPRAELRRLLRLLSTNSSDSDVRPTLAALSEDKLTANIEVRDLGDEVEAIVGFVSRYELNQQDFVNYLLSGDYDAQELASRFGCQVNEVEIILRLISHLEIVETFREDASVRAGDGLSSPIAIEQNVIAKVQMTSAGVIQVRMLNEHVSDMYLIDYERLENLDRFTNEQSKLLQAMHALNERTGALANIVQTICSIQTKFIASGDPASLSPISQSEIAQRVGYHRSVVSRLIRSQALLISNKIHSLAELMPRTKEVVARLVQAHPNWTDSQFKEYLETKLNVQISRRAVNYHRHALARTKGRKNSNTYSDPTTMV